MIDNGFFLDASTMLAPCLHDAIPETERETKKETKYMPPISQDLFNEYEKIRKAKRVAQITASVIAEARISPLTGRIGRGL